MLLSESKHPRKERKYVVTLYGREWTHWSPDTSGTGYSKKRHCCMWRIGLRKQRVPVLHRSLYFDGTSGDYRFGCICPFLRAYTRERVHYWIRAQHCHFVVPLLRLEMDEAVHGLT